MSVFIAIHTPFFFFGIRFENLSSVCDATLALNLLPRL